MTRYIEADKLIAHLKVEIKECEIPFGSRANGKSIAYGTALGLKSAISFVETLSTADVVPKSEVEKLEKEVLIWKQNRFNLYQRLELYEMAMKKGAIEVIEYLENEGLLNMTPQGIAELKKKYTEGEK